VTWLDREPRIEDMLNHPYGLRLAKNAYGPISLQVAIDSRSAPVHALG
jgi:hypothetical protein